MCGIAGKINFNQKKPVQKELIRKMCSVMNHRGPDDEGIYVYKNIGLGHKRLSIIDLSSAGRQPMSNENNTVWIVFNGEIYNFQELKKNLIKKGHKFKSSSDTEVIIHLYEDYKEKCLDYLRGMFAFAIWDEKNQTLFLARDRIGKKPLVYYRDSKSLLFASEINSLLCDKTLKKEINYEAIHYFLNFRYIPFPLTAFKNIQKLPPAHYLICQNGEIKIHQYWKLDFTKKLNLSEKEWQSEILDRLNESIKLRLVSDVPLGIFLSGGIDSSAIVGLASQISKKVKTFSIGFDDADYDETAYARIIAKKFNTEHHKFIVKPNIIEILPKLVWHYGEPFADASALATYYLAKTAKTFVTVALNGDGGDENFGGYDRYTKDQISFLYHFLPKVLKEKVIKKIINLFNNSSLKNEIIHRCLEFIGSASNNQEKKLLNQIWFKNNFLLNFLYTNEFKEEVKDYAPDLYLKEKLNQINSNNIVDKLLYLDMTMYLPDDLLVKTDIASMACSLEVRSPLLDHKFVEFTAKIPSNLKICGKKKKYIFKKAISNFIPKEILKRKKQGFNLPIRKWFRKDLKSYIQEILLDSKSINRGYFKKDKINQLLSEHIDKKISHTTLIWNLINLEFWHQQFIDKN